MKSPPWAVGGHARIGHGADGQVAGAAYVVERFQLTGLKNHLQVRGSPVLTRTGLLGVRDLVGDFVVAPREERAAVDDHVDLISPGGDGAPNVLEPNFERILAAGEAGGDGGDFDRAFQEVVLADFNERRVDADRGDGGELLTEDFDIALPRADGLAAQGLCLLGGVFAFQRCQVEHRQGQLETRDLG